MKKYRNRQGSLVYGLVDTLHIHIRYNEDDSLQEDLNRLFREGNDKIKKEVVRGRMQEKPPMTAKIPTKEALRAMKMKMTTT